MFTGYLRNGSASVFCSFCFLHLLCTILGLWIFNAYFKYFITECEWFNSAVKRTRVLEYLHRKSISCALIQETHLKQSDVARFQNKYYKLIAFSCAQNKTKGVLILVNRKLNLTVEHIGSDEKGRFVFIRCKIYNNRLALVLYLWSEWDRQCIPYTDFQNFTWGDWLPSSGGWWF